MLKNRLNTGNTEEKSDVRLPWWQHFWITTKKTTTATARRTAKNNIFTGCPKSSFLYFISLYFSTIGLGKQIILTKVVSFNIIHYFHTFCTIFSLPADVLWGSFVTHSFLPHGRLLNTSDFYVLDCLNKPISG